MNVGLVGFGKVAQRFHAPLISVEEGFRLTHVVERSANRSKQHYPQVEIVRSLDALLEEPVELVVVLTPNELHFPQARQALEAGKHVVLDKPMTVTSQEAEQLCDLAEQKGVTLTVFQNRRWDSDFLTLKSLLEENALGQLVEVESHFDRFRPNLKGGWRESEGPGTGILYDLGSHLLDQAFQLFGRPRALLADVRTQRSEARVDDFFEILLEFETVRVTLKSSCLAAEPRVRFLARGTGGAWLKYGMDPQEEALAQGQTPGAQDWGVEEASQWGTLYQEDSSQKTPAVAGNYPAFYSALADSLQNGGPPPVDPREAALVIKAIELCLESHRRRAWVPFTAPPKL